MAEENANERVPGKKIREYSNPCADGFGSSIVRPPVEANSFELKPSMIQMIQHRTQFTGLPNEDPNQHISDFIELCDTVKYPGVSQDAIRLRLFSFSLRDKAKAWLQSLAIGSITTWDELTDAFLQKCFPPMKSQKLRSDITNFYQYENESLYEAWERFKKYLRRLPHHGLPKCMLVQTFYNGLSTNTHLNIDAASGGEINNKTSDEAYDLLEVMVNNNYLKNDRNIMKMPSVMEVDEVLALKAQIAAIDRKISQLSVNAVQVSQVCELCAGSHASVDCQVGNPFAQPEQANYLNNFQKGQWNSYGNPYPHNYNPNWRTTHPNLSWSNNNQNMQKSNFQAPEKKTNAEDILSKFMESTGERMKSNEILMQNQAASIRNLEIQIGQIHNILSNRTQGTFPSDTEKNPKEQVNAVTLRSGRQLQEPQPKVAEKRSEESHAEEVIKEKEPNEPKKIEQNKYEDRLPYPNRLKRVHDEKQYSKFLDMFRSLHINVPFADMLEQMPKYAKFLKDILSNKRKLKSFETVLLTEESSAILKKKLPQKLDDPGSFTIPCIIGNVTFENGLCDLGASVNIIPYTLFTKLGIGEAKPTSIALQLADMSKVYPRGVLEDVLVKVDKFIFPIDLIVLDMEEDKSIPLILGRPFLATAQTLINGAGRKLKIRISDQKVEFNNFKSNKIPKDINSFCSIYIVQEEAIEKEFIKRYPRSTLENCIMNGISDEEDESEEVKEIIRELQSLPPIEPEKFLSYETNENNKEVIKEPPKLELKQLPSHLRYAFLEDKDNYPIIINASLTKKEEEKLLRVLREHKAAIGWTISDLKGISPSICMHKILMEESYKPTVQPQRRLNPTMQEVVKKEILKLLDAGIIYPISDSNWVSPIHVVPKKGGMTVIRNEKNELIPTRTVTGWRVCIDYRKLNDATRKDHFPLPFIDQMLERLAGHDYYCFLDGYSGYNQIAIAPEDQEKTTFTCPYGTFAYRRMPFGLCNAPATFQRCMMAIFSDMVEKFMEIFMDDFTITGDSFDQCLDNLTLVLQRCIKTNLVLNWEKCHFMVESGIVLGHKISKEGIEVDRAKVEVIEKLPPPTSIRGI